MVLQKKVRKCVWCNFELNDTKRKDALFCSPSCKQEKYRHAKHLREIEVTRGLRRS